MAIVITFGEEFSAHATGDGEALEVLLGDDEHTVTLRLTRDQVRSCKSLFDVAEG